MTERIHQHAGPTTHSLMQSLLLSCGLIGSLLFTATYLIEGVLHHGYSPIHETISSLEVVSHGWTQQLNFIVFGLLTVCFALGLRKELKGSTGATWFPLLQGFVAIGMIMSGVFVTEPLHTIGDSITFISTIIGFFVMAARFRKEPQWKGWMVYSLMSAFLMMTFLAAFGNAMHHGGDVGLYERLAGLVKSVWTIFFVGRLLTGTPLSAPKTESLKS